MKLTKVWVVKDPGPYSTLVDVLFQIEMNHHLENYILGSPRRAWTEENHTVYTGHAEAKRDAELRLQRGPQGSRFTGGKRRSARPVARAERFGLGARVKRIRRLGRGL